MYYYFRHYFKNQVHHTQCKSNKIFTLINLCFAQGCNRTSHRLKGKFVDHYGVNEGKQIESTIHTRRLIYFNNEIRNRSGFIAKFRLVEHSSTEQSPDYMCENEALRRYVGRRCHWGAEIPVFMIVPGIATRKTVDNTTLIRLRHVLLPPFYIPLQGDISKSGFILFCHVRGMIFKRNK